MKHDAQSSKFYKENWEDAVNMLNEKDEDIEFMLSIIREIYAIAGEDPAISKLCNKVISESRIPIHG